MARTASSAAVRRSAELPVFWSKSQFMELDQSMANKMLGFLNEQLSVAPHSLSAARAVVVGVVARPKPSPPARQATTPTAGFRSFPVRFTVEGVVV